MIISVRANASLPICNLDTAKQAIPPRIFAEQTIDGRDQNITLTRFLHNKIGIYASEFSRCYANVFDPNFIYHTVGIVGIITWLYFVYQIIQRKYYFLLIVLLALPLLPFLKFSLLPILFAYKLFAIIGLGFLLSKLK
ncbi:MAG: hypothetical protein Q7S45_04125 [Candidatus Curtissbacteria bacterium]|nr:hypothetical protein [Candidatus Curtissbacteria bacterium]